MADDGSARPALAEPGERGRLRIADRVVERIVVAAARGVPGSAAGAAEGITAPITRSYPRADVVVAGDRVRARVDVAGHWPVPVARLAADVRDTVSRQLSDLAGLRVDAVDVTVVALTREDAGAGRRRVR